MFETVYISIYFLLGLFVRIGLKKQFKKINKSNELICLEDITVIIPFRNEVKNLPKFIRSLNQQSKCPATLLFVNDHSTDRGGELIKVLKHDFLLLELPENSNGKKEAIRFAVKSVKTNYVLTLDADIELNDDYFYSLEKLSKSDFFVLPVVMKGTGLTKRFYELDFALSNAMNVSVSGLIRPFIASGANLLFNKTKFLQFDSYQDHKMIASGDDVFLLNDFRKNNCSIEVVSDLCFSVSTDAPNTFHEFISQRLRWIGKGKKVGDRLSNGLAFVAAFIHIVFVLVFIFQIEQQRWFEFFVFVVLKIALELIVYYPYFKKINRLITWVILPLSTFVYPIYILVLLVLLPIYRPKWKNR